MMRKITFTTLLPVMILLAGCAEDIRDLSGAVSGHVVDAYNEEYISAAAVTLQPGGNTMLTTSDGLFVFEKLDPGTYTLTASKSGYAQNSAQITVISGQNSVRDIVLKRTSVEGVLALSTYELSFNTSESSKSFSISNNGNAAFDWSIMGASGKSWLEVLPVSGRLQAGKSAAVSVQILREYLTSDEELTLIVGTGSESEAILIKVLWSGGTDEGGGNENGGNEGGSDDNGGNESGGNEGGSDDNGGNEGGGNEGGGNEGGSNEGGSDDSGGNDSGNTEDYSGATIESCDRLVEANIISCYRSGSSVVLTFTLLNKGLGEPTDFRIYTPNIYNTHIYKGASPIIYDDLGNEYNTSPYPSITIRGNTTYMGSVWMTFIQDVPIKGTLTVQNVPSKASKMNYKLVVEAYNWSPAPASPHLNFLNVPIY